MIFLAICKTVAVVVTSPLSQCEKIILVVTVPAGLFWKIEMKVFNSMSFHGFHGFFVGFFFYYHVILISNLFEADIYDIYVGTH